MATNDILINQNSLNFDYSLKISNSAEIKMMYDKTHNSHVNCELSLQLYYYELSICFIFYRYPVVVIMKIL